MPKKNLKSLLFQSLSDTDDPIHIINIAMRMEEYEQDNVLSQRFQVFCKQQVSHSAAVIVISGAVAENNEMQAAYDRILHKNKLKIIFPFWLEVVLSITQHIVQTKTLLALIQLLDFKCFPFFSKERALYDRGIRRVTFVVLYRVYRCFSYFIVCFVPVCQSSIYRRKCCRYIAEIYPLRFLKNDNYREFSVQYVYGSCFVI